MTPARIMIVEDDRVVARDLGQQLTSMGHTVVGTTALGEEALSRVLDTRADLVLMDIRLEGAMDGITAAQTIRDKCQTPVVFLTAYADEATIRRASQTDPFGYLLKPFEDLQLLTVIEMALYKHASERRLRDSERRYATTLASIGDGVISTDTDASITFMNPAAEVLTGWKQDEAVGRDLIEVFNIVNETTRQPVEAPAVLALRSGVAAGLPENTILITRDGREVPIDDSGAPVISDDGTLAGAVLVFSDVTRRRATEETLRRTQADLAHASRLTTLGELAASIAHEINQPLMASITNAEACLQWLTRPTHDIERAKEASKRVIRNGHRAAEVMNSIRALAKNSSPELVRLNVGAAIEDVLTLMRGELRRSGVTLQTGLPQDLPQVMADRVQIQQVVANLVLNAKEAMGDRSSPRCIHIGGNVADSHVTVEIADTGPGIASDLASQIFDPLFTTKADGLGLGLSICRSIIERHRGEIAFSPRDPHGSIFRFTLPRGDHEIGSSGNG